MENYDDEKLTDTPSLKITTDYDELQDYLNFKEFEEQERMVDAEIYFDELLESEKQAYRENLVDSVDEYLSQFTEEFIKRFELDEKVAALVVARALKGFHTLKLSDDMTSRVKSHCKLNGMTLDEQLVMLIEAGLEVQENE